MNPDLESSCAAIREKRKRRESSLTTIEPFLSLLVASALGSLIGLEREVHGQPAGLRTHMILSLGAALAAILSISYSEFISNPNLPSDPGRIVAQVVSGVGFLGAGAILRFGVSVKGLTTASSLWTTAIIGIACGSGYYELAAFTTVLVFIILTIINKLEGVILTSYKTRTFKVTLDDRPGVVNDIRQIMINYKIKIISLNVAMPNKNTVKLNMIIRMPSEMKLDKMIGLINHLDEARSMQID
tara:strand:+ start:3308 stop:4036 length:729 start_codon:yes stop_codon:yes gene_type:complete